MAAAAAAVVFVPKGEALVPSFDSAMDEVRCLIWVEETEDFGRYFFEGA